MQVSITTRDHQKETICPPNRFQHLFLDMYLMRWTQWANTMGVCYISFYLFWLWTHPANNSRSKIHVVEKPQVLLKSHLPSYSIHFLHVYISPVSPSPSLQACISLANGVTWNRRVLQNITIQQSIQMEALVEYIIFKCIHIANRACPKAK